MTNYYVIKDDKIVLFDEDKGKLQNTITLMPDYVELEILETERPIVDFQFADTPEYLAEQQNKEQSRINRLTMTALDFITILNQAGFTIQDRQQYFAKHPEVQEQLMYCQNVYCGIVRQLCPITINNKTVTDEMVVNAFRTKAGEI